MKRLSLISSCLLTCASSALMAQAVLNPNQVHLGSVQVGSSSTVAVKLTFPVAATLGLVIVQPGGAAATSEFTPAPGGTCVEGNSYAAKSTCTVEVSFTPLFAGKRYGAIQLLDSSTNLIVLTYLRGTGSAPQTSFMPGREIDLGLLPEVTGLALDGNNTLYSALGAYNDPDSYDEVQGNEVFYTENADKTYTYGGETGSWVEPLGIWADAAGNTYVYDAVQGLWNSNAGPILGSMHPAALTGDPFGNLFVIDSNTGTIYKEALQPDAFFPQDSTYLQSTVTAASSTVQSPYGLWLDWSGNLYVEDASYLHKWTAQADGTFIETYRTDLIGKVTIDGGGNLYGYASTDGEFYKESLQTDGTYLRNKIASNITNPGKLAADGLGNIYYTDSADGVAPPYEKVAKEDFTQAPAFTFPETAQGSTSAAKTVIISNSGTSPLKISAITFPADFVQTNTGEGECANKTTLAAGANCTLTISFAPRAKATPGVASILSESVVVTTNSLNIPATKHAIAVTGQELGLTATTTGISLSQGTNVMVGEKLTLTVTVKPSSGSAVSAGTVTLASPDTSDTATVTLDKTGNAVIQATAPAVGTWRLYAIYNGSASLAGSRSSTITATVNSPRLKCAECSTRHLARAAE